ncbi:MAG: diacylglycerol kinase [Candidatus Omnitrophota bacterium]|nr:diacylglycerol kinase [Candidatus Omnitrophota bacterium]
MRSLKKSKEHCGKGFSASVSAALEGVVHTLEKERNMRIHFLVGFFVLIAAIYFNVTGQEFMLLCFAVTFVLVSEMINTAIEYTIDLISDEYHPLAKVIKDIAAGAVFVSVVNAALTGYIILVRRVFMSFDGAFSLVKSSSWHITLIILLGVVGIVLMVKILRKEKNLLRGGMPSGHSAVAFAIWAVISLFTENTLVSMLVFLLALLIAKSRMTGRIHTLSQVVLGGILGIVTAVLVFQMLS